MVLIVKRTAFLGIYFFNFNPRHGVMHERIIRLKAIYFANTLSIHTLLAKEALLERGLPMCLEYQYILIVDDNAGVRRLLFEVLSDEGYIVESVSSGTEAIQKVRDRTPSIILLDAKMPGMNGIETLRELRKFAPDVPIVVITAYEQQNILVEAKKFGVRYYMNKPFDINEIKCMVRGIFMEEESCKRLERLNEIS